MDKVRSKIIELLGLKKSEIPDGEGLEGFSDEQLDAAITKARETYVEARSKRDLDGGKELVEFVESIKTEKDERSKVDSQLADLDARMEPETTQDPEPEPPADPDPEPEPTPDPEPTPEPQTVKVEEATDPAKTAEKVAEKIAADATPEPPAPPAEPKKETATKPKPVPAPSASPSTATPEPVVASLVASGDVEGHSAGARMEPTSLGEAFVNKSQSVLMARATGRNAIATVRWLDQYDDDRFLKKDSDIDVNTKKIMEMVASAQEQTYAQLKRILATSDLEEIETLTAEGGLCAPVNVRYDIFTVGSTARPLRDSFVRFGATRGGIRFNAPPTLADIDVGTGASGAVNVYTEAQDTSGANYPKGCQRIDCGEDTEVAVSAIPLCMIVGNYDRMFYPENFQAWWGLGRVAHARQAETTLWNRMETLSLAVSAVTAADELSATPDIFAALDRSLAQFRWRHRIDPRTPLRVRTQAWVQNYLRADLVRRQPGDDTLAVTDAQIARFFAARNAAVTFVLDANSPGGVSGDVQAAGALNPWPDSVEINVSVEGSFFFLDGGSLNFGTEIRDFDQIRDNDSAAFMETFEELALVGPQPLHLSIDTCPRGLTSGQNDSYDPCGEGS